MEINEKIETNDSSIIQMQLDALLREYESLRQEATHCDSTQMSLATSAFGFLTACFTLSGIFARSPTDSFLVYCVLPCFSMFFGLLWIDQLFRRIRFGTYMRRTENKIDLLIPKLESNGTPVRILEFERWISELDDNLPLLRRPRFIYGFILTGTWLIVPVLIPICSQLFLFSEIVSYFSFFDQHPCVSIVMSAVGCIYYFYLTVLIYRIYTFPKESNLP